jgi:hypothetical protein
VLLTKRNAAQLCLRRKPTGMLIVRQVRRPIGEVTTGSVIAVAAALIEVLVDGLGRNAISARGRQGQARPRRPTSGTSLSRHRLS